MKKKSKDEKIDELRPEYDLGDLLKGGVQGKYADRSHDQSFGYKRHTTKSTD